MFHSPMNNRRFVLGLLTVLMPLSMIQFASAAARGGSSLVYIGTYTGPKSKGIYAYRLDGKSGALEPLGCSVDQAAREHLVRLTRLATCAFRPRPVSP